MNLTLRNFVRIQENWTKHIRDKKEQQFQYEAMKIE